MDRELIREWNKIFNHVWDTKPNNINLAKLLEIHNYIKRDYIYCEREGFPLDPEENEKCTTTN